MSKNLRFSETEYQELVASLKNGKETPATLSAPKKRIKKNTEKDDNSSVENLSKTPTPVPELIKPTKKRLGVKEVPILQSITEASPHVEYSDNHIAFVFTGMRLFTLNEMYAIMQYRKYISFAYKKQLKQLIIGIVSKLPKTKAPFFDSPCKVTVFRQGAKKVDLDNFESMFKALIDGLKADSKQGYRGIIPDDNPEILYDFQKLQSIGEPIIGLRLERIYPVPTVATPQIVDILNEPEKYKPKIKKTQK